VSSVLIAPADHLNDLTAQESPASAFPDSDALQALQAIVKQRPEVVVLDHAFASTSRGAALVNRIKADPSLATCEIRVVQHGAAAAPAAPATATAVLEAPAPAAALDVAGTRRAPRYEMAEGTEALVDNQPVTVVDLSTVGAQVVSPLILKPKQRVRVTLPEAGTGVRLRAVVAWAVFEMPKGTPQYRAGLEFLDSNPEPVDRFREAHQA